MPLLERIISLVAPHNCFVCGAEGSVLCSVCLELELPPVPSRCYRCQQATSDFAVCQNCRRHTALRHVWVRTLYDKSTSKLVLGYKFERVRAAHLPLSLAMGSVLPVLASDTLLLAVPTATSRIRQRGYDHTRLLAGRMASSFGLVHSSPVIRLGQTHQFGARRSERLKQLQQAFHVVSPDEVKGRSILLIDDVLTTGATLETLARVLKDVGAKRVDAVVFAQKV